MAFDEPEQKHPGGRPTKYDPAFCERVMELGAEGRSKVEIAFEIGVDRKTLDNWSDVHPEFFHAITRAKLAEQAWWERKGRENIDKPIFQASMWSRSMAARFPDDWREVSRQERSGPDGKPQEINHSGSVAVSEVIGRIARLAAREAEAGNPDEPR